jgi:tRNA pseudouridine32 synthase/23S rRNA pseudouridine746 synthase
MMGVLVVRSAAGQLGYLRAFAGAVGERDEVEGFVPPLFEVDVYREAWREGSALISEIDARIESARQSGAVTDALREEQRKMSHAIHEQLWDSYSISNARGERRKLRDLFTPRNPPGGAGDCAAPKLLAFAYKIGATPIALGEFWWGAPPPGGGRQHGRHYPSCRGRCGVLLPYMLEGLELEPAPDVGMRPAEQLAMESLFEDEHIWVVNKAHGMLSVRGRGPSRQDCVEARMQARANLEDSTWPRLAHRLDLATSGLLVAAKNRDSLVALQRQFSARKVDKRYVAVVQGRIEGTEGRIDFPIGRDLHDRPRQCFDPNKGKASITRWRLLGYEDHRSRVELSPETGRTHQLRLHCAHERGLGAPIVGDRLYGFGGERLLLHARDLVFSHPSGGETMRFETDCPF